MKKYGKSKENNCNKEKQDLDDQLGNVRQPELEPETNDTASPTPSRTATPLWTLIPLLLLMVIFYNIRDMRWMLAIFLCAACVIICRNRKQK